MPTPTSPPADPVSQPVINSPYDYPRWHYRIGADGVAQGPAREGRRPSEAYVAPVPAAWGQPGVMFGTEDPQSLMQHVAELRGLVEDWRAAGYPGATEVSRELLSYWQDPERDFRLYFAQLDAVRTLIYLAEAAPDSVRERLAAVNAECNDGMSRAAVKMATGVGKTAVMAMTVLWQAANHWENPADPRFTNRFVAVAPGITVRDRLLSGLRADSTDHADVYEEMDLLPFAGEYRKRINSAQVEVVNFHQFLRRKIDAGASKVGKTVSGYEDRYETEVESLSRALGDLFELGGGRAMALNDEGHHCHRDSDKSVEGRESAVWYGGLLSLHQRGKLHSVVDFSATPMFISGDRKRRGKLFPWVVSDYPIVDAIEAGIVKIPNAPVADNLSRENAPLFRDIYNLTKRPKSGFMDAKSGNDGWINEDLDSALRTMYDSYAEESRRWESTRADSKVPALVVVANTISNADGLFRYIAGYENADGTATGGRLGELLSNADGGAWRETPRTIFMHSKMESDDGAVSAAIAKPVRTLANMYRKRYPNARLSEDRRDRRRLADGTDCEVLRKALNTVGKSGEPGENVRCVVSVGMITEGWDARTVTHMVGFRAFGSQLLCEQVGGRTLRRRVYETDENGMFAPEYSTVVGVPWDYVQTAGEKNGNGGNGVEHPVITVRFVPGRERHRVRWPNLVGYDSYGDDDALTIGVEDWDGAERLALDRESTRRTTVASIPGATRNLAAKPVKFRRIAFLAAADFVSRQRRRYAAEKSVVVDNADLFKRALAVIDQARERGVVSASAGRVYDETVGTERELSDWLNRIATFGESARRRGVEAVLDDGAPLKSYIPFQEYETRREHVYETRKSEISHAVCDSGWEVQVARNLDRRADVIGWVRNERLNWFIPWLDESERSAVWRRYLPDFVARVRVEDGGAGGVLNLVIEVKGEERESDRAKRAYAEDYWIPAVNSHPEFRKTGRWEYLYVTDPDALDAMMDEAKKKGDSQ